MAQMTRTHARVCLFWLSLILHPILVIKLPQNSNFWGVNRHFPAKRVKYWNVHIIETTASTITKFCRVIVTHKYSLWVVQLCPKRIQYGGRPPSWKFEKSQYLCNGTTDCDEIWHSCVWALQTPSAKKIHKFENPRWRQPPFWKIEKS